MNYLQIPKLHIDNIVARIPIIQGGMGVGVSMAGLASAVANEGGIGVISGAQIGYREADFETNHLQANLRAIRAELRKARQLSPNGIIGINLMVALQFYKELVIEAVKEGVDLIISGAGLPRELPAWVPKGTSKLAPIVSSGRAAKLIAKMWDKKYDRTPDLVIVEGPLAGGHLGFKQEEFEPGVKLPTIYELITEVNEAMQPYREKYKQMIPVIAAGGIYTGEDIARALKAGAKGVQMATRFVATEECDADIAFKEAYVNAQAGDVQIIRSPVGMPGRALRNHLIKRLEEARLKIERCYQCLKICNPKVAPYCITKALVESVNGDVENGLVFAGANVPPH